MQDQAHPLPLRRAEGAALFVLIVQTVAAGVALLLARVSDSPSAEAEAWHLLIGAFVWLGAFIHQRLRRLADEEAHTAQALAAEPGRAPGSSLFEGDSSDLLSARSRLAQFEKYFLPVFSILVFLALAAASYLLLRQLVTTPKPPAIQPIQRALMAAVVFVGIAFVSFLLAMYTAGLATQAPWRPVRPGASYSMSCAVASLFVVLALGGDWCEFPYLELGVSYAIPALLGVMALEVLVNLILGIYRPRTVGQELRPAHDSRLLGALTTRGGVLRATAETLDYQFGFRVSETWFFRFMERALAPLILFQALTLYLLTCFVIVDTGEQAIIERFGRPLDRAPLGPGLHFKWPWPIDIVRRASVGRIELLTIGEQIDEKAEAYLWTVSHAKTEFQLLIANREETGATLEPKGKDPADKVAKTAVAVSLLSGGVYVYYTIDNIKEYLYNFADPRGTLSAVCTEELTRYAAGADFLDFLGTGRARALAALQGRFQHQADSLHLGIRVVSVNLQGIHPPYEVGDAFEEVIGAFQEQRAAVLRAEAERNEIIPKARADATRIVLEAQAYSVNRTKVSEAVATRFVSRLASYTAAPRVYLYREVLSAIEEAWADRRKIVKPNWVNADEVLIINLEDRILPMQETLDQEGAGQ